MKPAYPIRISPTAAAISGVSSYRLTSRGLSVWMADGTFRRLSKAKMPPPEKLSAFTIADALSS